MDIDIENLLQKEIGIILGKEAASLEKDTLLSSLGMDSMSFVELLVFIEKRFKIKLMESGLKKEDFQTITALAARISKEIS
jgi:acyl carrier protein